MEGDPIIADAGYYGTQGALVDEVAAFAKPPMRQRLNCFALLQSILLPCGIFTGSLIMLSFSVRHEHAGAVAFMIVCGFVVSLSFAYKAYVLRLRAAQGEDLEPSWFLFLAVTCLVASVAGLLLGNANFSATMSPYYDLAGMGVATGVDPGAAPGQRHMDASRIVFQQGARIMENLSMSFKDTNQYCVAPIAMGNRSTPPASYDYFAVGVNCCSMGGGGLAPSFWCGSQELDDRQTHAGLRYMGDRYYFGLAIQQAQAQFHFASHNPVLFTWTRDPIGDVQAMRSAGVSFVVTWAVVHCCIQTLLVMLIAAGYSPIGAQIASSVRTSAAAADTAIKSATMAP